MWYFVSGNLDKIFDEVYFDFARLEMSNGSFIQIEVKPEKKRNTKKIIISFNRTDENYMSEIEIPFESYEQIPSVFTSESSLFFPTFRRIEGGFSINTNSFLLLNFKKILFY